MMARALISGLPLTLVFFMMLTSGSTAQVRGNTVLTLSDAPDVNVLGVTLSALGEIQDEEDSELSGTVSAILEIDPETDQVSEFTLTSGDLTATDMNFSLLGGLIADVSISDIKATITTFPAGLVEVETGQFDAGMHEVTLNEGSITGTSIGGAVNEDFSQNPVSGAGSGIGTVSITRVAAVGNIVAYEILVVLPLEFSNPLQDGVEVLVEGTVQMEGSIEVPLDPYLGWTELNGIAEAPFAGDHDGDGIPNGLLWALGYGANDRPALFTPDLFSGGQVDIVIEPGPNGTLAPIIVEESHDLEEWTQLDPFLIMGFENPVPTGEVWPIVLLLSGDQNFVRLRVEKP